MHVFRFKACVNRVFLRLISQEHMMSVVGQSGCRTKNRSYDVHPWRYPQLPLLDAVSYNSRVDACLSASPANGRRPGGFAVEEPHSAQHDDRQSDRKAGGDYNPML